MHQFRSPWTFGKTIADSINRAREIKNLNERQDLKQVEAEERDDKIRAEGWARQDEQWEKEKAHTLTSQDRLINLQKEMNQLQNNFLRIEKAIKKNKSILGNLKKRTYNGMEKTHAVNDKLKVQENALKMIEENIQHKKEFKMKRNEAE